MTISSLLNMFQYQDKDTEYSNQAEATILSILDDDSTTDYSSNQRTNTHPLSTNVNTLNNTNSLSLKNQQYLFAPIQSNTVETKSTPIFPTQSLPSYHEEKTTTNNTNNTTTTAVSSADIDSYFTYNNTDHPSTNTSSTTGSSFTRPKAITMNDLTFSFDINTNNHTIHNTHNKLHRQTLLKKSESEYTTSSETTAADNSLFHSTASPTNYLTSTHSSFYFPTSTLTPTITPTTNTATSTLPIQPLSLHVPATTNHTTTFNNTILNTTTTHNTLINPLSLNRDDFPHNYDSPLTNTNTYTMNNTHTNTSLNTSVNNTLDNFSPTAYGLKSLYTDKNTTNTYQTTYPKQAKQTNHSSNLMKKGIINFGSQCNPSEKLGACSWCVADEYG